MAGKTPAITAGGTPALQNPGGEIMRAAGITILVILVLIVIALLVAPSFVNVNQYHGRIQADLSQRLGRPVTLGQMHLRLLPPRFRVENVSIGEDPRFGTGPFAQAQNLYVSVKLLPLLQKQLEIKSLELGRPRIELIRNPQGVWNFASLGQTTPSQAQPAKPQPPAPPKPAPAPAQATPNAPGQALSLDHLKITDGTVALTDEQKHQSRAVYDHIDVDLSDFAPNKAFNILASVRLPGKGAQTARLDGKIGPVNPSNMVATPVDATLKMNSVQLSGVQKFLNTEALAGTDAIISGELGLKNASGNFAADGTLTLNQAKVRGVDIGYPINADIKAADNLNADTINIQRGDIKLGPTPFSIAGTMNTRSSPAQIDLQLKATNASIAELARLAAGFGAGFNANTKVSGTLNADVHAKGATDKPELNGNLRASGVQVSGGQVPQPVKLSDVQLQLTPQSVRSNDFTASTGGTSVAAQFTLNNYTTANPVVEGSLKTTNADIAELLNIGRAYGVSALNGMKGSGVLTLDVHATGAIKNTSAMTFNGTGEVKNASIKAPSLTEPVAIHSANLHFTQNSAVVDNLAASVAGTNATGMMTMRNFSAPVVQFTLSADHMNIARLQQLTAAPGTQPQPAKRASTAWELVPAAEAQTRPAPAQPRSAPQAGKAPAPSIVEKMTGNGSIAVGQVVYDQLILNNVRSNVTLDHGLIHLAPVTAQLYKGQENGNITLDLRQTPMSIVVSTNMQGVDANGLLSSVTSLKNTLYGLLAANGNTNFRATTANDIARTLNGKLLLNLNNGRLAGIDLLNELAKVGKFAGFTQAAQPFTDIVKLSGGFDVSNGLAQTNNLQATIAGGTLAAAGAVNLATQALNMHLTAVLDKAMSQKVGGTSIGGFMNTALANRNGELVIPVIVTGTFQHPTFAPDLQKIAQMKMQNLLPTTGNPGQLTSGILGAVLGKKSGQQGGLGGILGSLGGQQPKPPQGNQPVANPQSPPPQQGAQQPPPQQQQKNKNPFGDVLNSILQQQKQKQQQQQQQQPQTPPPK